VKLIDLFSPPFLHPSSTADERPSAVRCLLTGEPSPTLFSLPQDTQKVRRDLLSLFPNLLLAAGD